MQKRDLVAELAIMKAKASGDAVVMLPTAKRRAADPPAPVPEPEEMTDDERMAKLKLARHLEMDTVIVVSASDGLLDLALRTSDAEVVHDLDKIQGAYHATEFTVHGCTVFKGIEADVEKYLFKGQGEAGGWYVADYVFATEKSKNRANKSANTKVWIGLWCSGEDRPDVAHFPYWASKPEKEIKIMPIWEYSLRQTEKLVGQTEKIAELEAELATAKLEVADVAVQGADQADDEQGTDAIGDGDPL